GPRSRSGAGFFRRRTISKVACGLASRGLVVHLRASSCEKECSSIGQSTGLQNRGLGVRVPSLLPVKSSIISVPYVDLTYQNEVGTNYGLDPGWTQSYFRLRAVAEIVPIMSAAAASAFLVRFA